jgi:hypothetical protein
VVGCFGDVWVVGTCASFGKRDRSAHYGDCLLELGSIDECVTEVEQGWNEIRAFRTYERLPSAQILARESERVRLGSATVQNQRPHENVGRVCELDCAKVAVRTSEATDIRAGCRFPSLVQPSREQRRRVRSIQQRSLLSCGERDRQHDQTDRKADRIGCIARHPVDPFVIPCCPE